MIKIKYLLQDILFLAMDSEILDSMFLFRLVFITIQILIQIYFLAKTHNTLYFLSWNVFDRKYQSVASAILTVF